MLFRLIVLLALLHSLGCGKRAAPTGSEDPSDALLVDTEAIARIIDLPGVPKSGNYRVTLPSTIGALSLEGFPVGPSMSLESWVTFYRDGDSVSVVGEILADRESVAGLEDAVRSAGLEASGPRLWLGPDGPVVWVIDLTGRGTETELAASVKTLSAKIKDPNGTEVAADTLLVHNTLDTGLLGLSFMSRGNMIGGVYQVGIARRELEFSIPDVPEIDGLGYTNKTYWQGTSQRAAVIGRLTMLPPVADQVSAGLKEQGFVVSGPYTPPLKEGPGVLALRFFGAGPLKDLVRAIRDALSATAVHSLPEHFDVEVVNRHLDDDATAFALLDEGRIVVAHQRSGELQLLVNGTRRAAPLLTVPNLLWSYEQGFVGVAVDPEFPDSNYVYTFNTRRDSVNRVARYRITGDLRDPTSDRLFIDETTEQVLIDVFDAYEYHNGGTLRFGPDEKLYVSTGDDATLERIQDLTDPKAKILRINRDGSAPEDNPTFPSEPADRLQEIFAIGFRNPFRFTIDPISGILLVSDVGSVYNEEFNLSKGGENFGWPLYEGDRITYADAQLLPPEPTFPVYHYERTSPLCAAIALASYRQVDFPNDFSFPDRFEGTHFVADFRAGPILNLQQTGHGNWEVQEFATGFSRPVDGARGPDGSLYVLEYGRALKRIVYLGSTL